MVNHCALTLSLPSLPSQPKPQPGLPQLRSQPEPPQPPTQNSLLLSTVRTFLNNLTLKCTYTNFLARSTEGLFLTQRTGESRRRPCPDKASQEIVLSLATLPKPSLSCRTCISSESVLPTHRAHQHTPSLAQPLCLRTPGLLPRSWSLHRLELPCSDDDDY